MTPMHISALWFETSRFPVNPDHFMWKLRYSVNFILEYGKATLEIHKDSISEKERVVVIDDLIATGGTAEAAAKLIEKSGGEVAGFVFVINLFDMGGKKLLEKKGYNCFSLIDFPGH